MLIEIQLVKTCGKYLVTINNILIVKIYYVFENSKTYIFLKRESIFQDIVSITSEYMLKPPFKPMKISSHKFLSRSSLCHVQGRQAFSGVFTKNREPSMSACV